MKILTRFGFAAALCFMLANIASSATSHSGGGDKKQDHKSTLKINFKNAPLTLQNGFRFRGGFSFNTTLKNDLILKNAGTVRFQRGNNLYVMPYKSKPFFQKLKTPQKEIR